MVILGSVEVPDVGIKAPVDREVVRRLVPEVALADEMGLVRRAGLLELAGQQRELQGPGATGNGVGSGRGSGYAVGTSHR